MANFLLGKIRAGELFTSATGPYDIFLSLALDASGDKIAIVFQAPAGGSITTTKLGFRHASKTGTPPTYKIGLQGVSVTTGAPDGTYKGGGSPASATFTPNGAYGSGTWHDITLDNSYATTSGELLAWVIEYSSGTINGSNFSSFTYGIYNGNTRVLLPYQLTNTGSWAKTQNYISLFAFHTASRIYGVPIKASGLQGVTSTTEVGMAFTLDADYGDTFELAGVVIQGNAPPAGQLYTVTLYSGGGASSPTILQQVQLDTDQLTRNANTDYVTKILFDEASLSTLSFGTQYHIGISSDVSWSPISLYTLESAAHGDAFAMPGQSGFYVNRTISTYPPSGDDTNAFTPTTTKIPMIALVLDDWTEPAGGGGTVRSPTGMTGGLV